MNNHPDLFPTKSQFPLEIGPGHARHRDVEDQAIGLIDVIGSEELFRGRERLHPQNQTPSVDLEATRARTRRHDDRHQETGEAHAFLIPVAHSPPQPSECRQRCGHLTRCSGSRGMEKDTVAPGPSFNVAQRRPRWRSMIERLTARPIPIPSCFVV